MAPPPPRGSHQLAEVLAQSVQTAGDVLAERAVEILRRFAEEPANR